MMKKYTNAVSLHRVSQFHKQPQSCCHMSPDGPAAATLYFPADRVPHGNRESDLVRGPLQYRDHDPLPFRAEHGCVSGRVVSKGGK